MSAWRKSSYSAESFNCVEVGRGNGHVHVRDSKDPHGGQLTFDTVARTAFINAVRTGELAGAR